MCVVSINKKKMIFYFDFNGNRPIENKHRGIIGDNIYLRSHIHTEHCTLGNRREAKLKCENERPRYHFTHFSASLRNEQGMIIK